MALAGLMVAFTVDDPNAALIRLLVGCVMTSEGTEWDPPPYINDIASPGATRPIRTPIAPACAARSIFRLTGQAPRSINAILPLGSVKYGSSGLPVLMESAGQPRPT